MTVLRIPCSYDADTDNTTRLATGQTLRVGLDGTTVYRAALKFSVSGLPASCDISRVELEVTVRKGGGPAGKWDIRPLGTNGTTDPATQTAAQLYTACATGTPYVNDSALFRHTGRHRILLGLGTGATACTDIEVAAAAVGDIFSLGLMEQGDDDAYCELEAVDYTDSDYPAELIITYNETATALSLLQSLARRIDEAHYESGTLTTSSATVPADTALVYEDNWWEDFWLLIGAGTAIGQSRRINTFTSSGGIMTLARALSAAPTSVAYYLLPTSPVLMARAINAAVAELFPHYLHLPASVEVGVQANHVYDVPAGMIGVDRVEYRYDGDNKEWHLASFDRPDEGRVQIVQGSGVPTSGVVIRIAGRQRLTQIVQADPLTLTGTIEVTDPDAGQGLLTELLLTVAERNLEKWLRAKEIPAAPLGTTRSPASQGMARSDRLSMLTAYELQLKQSLRWQTPKVRHPVRNPMP